MAVIESSGGYYVNPHQSQYGHSARLSRMGCTPTSGANGANASTGGKTAKTGDEVLALVPQYAETDPSTPGWSARDLARAMGRIGVPYEVRSGQGWAGVVSALSAGCSVVLQGDSDQFPGGTCSGAFDGDHAIHVHPATQMVGALRQRWINDPICPTGRFEYEYILHRYASKLAAAGQIDLFFGVFTTPVPKIVQPPPAPKPPLHVTLSYGGKRITYQRKVISVPRGRMANVRTRPHLNARVVSRLANGQIFKAYQRTTTGQNIGGSPIWYGDYTGTRWLHISAF